jgi:hypothetical protein
LYQVTTDRTNIRMTRHPSMIVRVLALALVVSCGGGEKKKTPVKPQPKVAVAPAPKPETEEDREAKRHAAALAIVPDGSACFPAALKEANAPLLELGAVGSDAIICALDRDKSRLLGPVACWKIDLAGGALAYQAAAPLPGRNVDVLLAGGCARGYCLPKDAKAPADGIAHLAWNLDGSKVAVLAGDDVHLFDAASKNHESSFTVRGDKGVTNDPSAIAWVGDELFVEGADQGPYAAVWVFKQDGTQAGPLVAIGSKDGKPMSSYGGSFALLDKTRVGVSERGFTTLSTYEIDTGKRAKISRKVPTAPCKADELDAYWHANEAAVGAKCKDFMDKNYGHLIGADVVAGSKNFLALLRGARLGELAVLDAKTLAEKKSIKLPWCGEGGGGAAAGEKPGAAKDAPVTEEKAVRSTRGAVPKAAAKPKAEDPDQGGQ